MSVPDPSGAPSRFGPAARFKRLAIAPARRPEGSRGVRAPLATLAAIGSISALGLMSSADGDPAWTRLMLAGEVDLAQLDPELALLTPREREVLQLIARGYLYKEVALALEVSPKTVAHHVSAVLRKLRLANRHQLSRWAARRRLVD